MLLSLLAEVEAEAPRGLNSRNRSLCLGILGSWHAWLFCPQKWLWFGRQILKALLYSELFNPHCPLSPLPRLILGAGRWLQAATSGHFGKSQPIGEGWGRTQQGVKQISEALWDWLKLSCSPGSGGLGCNVFNSLNLEQTSKLTFGGGSLLSCQYYCL